MAGGMGQNEQRHADEDMFGREFHSTPAIHPQHGKQGLEPQEKTGDEDQEQQRARSGSHQHIKLSREKQRKHRREEPRRQESRPELQKIPEQCEQAAEEREPGVAQQYRERQAPERPPEHAVRHVSAEMIDLGDQDDRCAVEQIAKDEQPDGGRRSARPVLPHCETMGSGRQDEQSRHPHPAWNRVPVRPDHRDQREPDEEESQNDQHAVRGGTTSYPVVVDAVEPADRSGLIDGDQLLVDPGRYLRRQVLLEQADQSQCRTLHAGFEREARRGTVIPGPVNITAPNPTMHSEQAHTVARSS